MTSRHVHLNFLRESEKLSSSPIRLRVMIPLGLILACVGVLLWWGMVATQLIIVRAQIANIEEEIRAKESANAAVLAQMVLARERQKELEQLTYYAHARRTWGETLAALAEVMPLKIQLTELSLTLPPAQSLAQPPPAPPLWGPTVTTEEPTLRLSGRTTKETPVISLMESLADGVFTNTLVICKDPAQGVLSPKVNSFRQDSSGRGASGRLLSFEVEYRAAERRFQP